MYMRMLPLIFIGIFLGVGSYLGLFNGVKEQVYNYILVYKKPSDWNDRGVDYITGHGVSQNYQQAAKWFRKAAKQGESFAQRNLGILYATGLGGSQDHNEAFKWFRIGGTGSNGTVYRLKDYRDLSVVLIFQLSLHQAWKMSIVQAY